MNPATLIAPYWHLARARLFRGRVPGGAPSIRLPFNESPVLATYLHTAYFFGILTADAPCDGLLNIFIQLSAPRRREDKLNVLPLRFLPTIPVDELGLLESREWPIAEVNRLSKPELIAAIVGALEAGWYLYVHVDCFYLPGTAFYGKRHFRQSALVLGYDSAARQFHVACYLKKGLFGVTRMPCRLLADGFYSPLGRANSTNAASVNRLHGMRRPGVAGDAARLDVNAIRWQLADYLNGTNEAPWRMDNQVIRRWSDRYDKSTAADTVYGMGIYEALGRQLPAPDAAENTRIDFRITRLIWEHKKLMSVRLRRLAERGIVVIPGLNDRWAGVERLAWSLHFNLFRSVIKKERIDRVPFESSVRELASRERELLGPVLGALERL